MEKDTKEEVISLSDEHLIGKGRHKSCYIHPKNDKLCIKFTLNEGGDKDLDKELYYYGLRKKRNLSSDILPAYHGEIATIVDDEALTGYVFDFIKNYDGSAPLALGDYLRSEDALKANFDTLVHGLRTLKKSMISQRVATSTVHPWNIVYQKTSGDGGKFIIIDNIGSLSKLPVEYYLDFMAYIKIRRKWKRTLKYMSKKYDSPLVHKLAKLVK